MIYQLLDPRDTYPQTEEKDHPVSLGFSCGQHVNFPIRCWL